MTKEEKFDVAFKYLEEIRHNHDNADLNAISVLITDMLEIYNEDNSYKREFSMEEGDLEPQYLSIKIVIGLLYFAHGKTIFLDTYNNMEYTDVAVLKSILKDNMKYFKKGMDVVPENSDLLYDMAQMNRYAENIQEAKYYVEKGLALEPGSLRFRALKDKIDNHKFSGSFKTLFFLFIIGIFFIFVAVSIQSFFMGLLGVALIFSGVQYYKKKRSMP